MNNTIPFRPKLEGEFRNRFHLAASQITSETNQEEIEKLVEEEIQWVENDYVFNLPQRKKYRAIWMLFRDLTRASWKAVYTDGTLEMSLPTVNNLSGDDVSISSIKSYMRSWMSESRLERMLIGSEFIKGMEKPNAKGFSIKDLIADGYELSERLLKYKNNHIGIDQAISPYLQLVVEGEKDRFTGLKISDIWRYFRYTWSTPYETTPGRTMQYLIRDAAHPMHAVMGIASLENCALQITCRDQFIGWEAEAYIQRIKEKNSDSFALDCFSELCSLIDEGIESIDYSEFCTKKDIQEPSIQLVEKLQRISIESEEERKSNLKEYAESYAEGDIVSNVADASSDALYRKKRSGQLAKLLSAKKLLTELKDLREGFSDAWRRFVESPNGYTAIRTSLLVQKSKHIGSSMLELNVCGAVPPYNEVLAGKLVALLALSPKIITDYKERYADQPSEIASKLKGEKVYKPSDLVYIGTTSLYSVGSSQYNRLKIPSKVIGSQYDIVWKEIGKTYGYGTLHISKETTTRLNEAVSQDGYSTINHVFGEGASPKMRLLRTAISQLLETSERESTEFSKHAMSRIVYGACIADNTLSYLLGVDTCPKYYFDKNNAIEKTQCIIDFWRNRWFGNRLNYDAIFERIAQFDKKSLLLSNAFKDESVKKTQDMTNTIECVNDVLTHNESLSFIRNFYRGNSAFADFLEDKYLQFIHIETKLDDAIITDLKSGRDVVLTGNPGDGKTHIIRMLKQRIEELNLYPVYELDASTKGENELYDEWVKARENNRPFMLAINAALLHSMAETKNDKFIQSARDQMTHAVTYSNSHLDDFDVTVYDLSKRDALSKDIICAVLNKMVSDDFYNGCKNCVLGEKCPVHRNRKELQNNLFQDRLFKILRRASLTGFHATLRDLQSLSSFLLFGGLDCKDIIKKVGSGDNEVSYLLYKGKGKIFDAIKNSFDPASVSHPVWDERILSSNLPEDGWSDNSFVSKESLLPSNESQFIIRKRQFFFFHKSGEELLNISSDDVSMYQAFLEKDERDQLKEIIEKLNYLFGCNNEHKALWVWICHRYDNKPRRMLISAGKIARSKFQILRPRLQQEMEKGIVFDAPYIKLCLKSNPSTSLRIDFDIYHMLLCNQRGLPNLLLESEEVKRVWRFMDLLNSESEDEDDEKEVIISDLQSNKKVTVTIDTESLMYNSIK